MPVDKIANPLAAANAYQNTANSAAKPGVSAGGSDFLDMLRKSAENSIDSIRQGEKASADAVAGKATLTDVVQAVTEADLTLQTVIAMRDRLVGAYQDIMRMPI